jgi:hypothetical protein
MTQIVLFYDAVLAVIVSVRKYDVVSQNADCSSEGKMRNLVLRNKVRYENATSLQNSIWRRYIFR